MNQNNNRFNKTQLIYQRHISKHKLLKKKKQVRLI